MMNKAVVVSAMDKKHTNPIAELVQLACTYDSDIFLVDNTRRINAKSIMGIMALHPSEGMKLEIETKGADEEEALPAIEKFLVCG